MPIKNRITYNEHHTGEQERLQSAEDQQLNSSRLFEQVLTKQNKTKQRQDKERQLVNRLCD